MNKRQKKKLEKEQEEFKKDVKMRKHKANSLSYFFFLLMLGNISLSLYLPYLVYLYKGRMDIPSLAILFFPMPFYILMREALYGIFRYFGYVAEPDLEEHKIGGGGKTAYLYFPIFHKKDADYMERSQQVSWCLTLFYHLCQSFFWNVYVYFVLLSFAMFLSWTDVQKNDFLAFLALLILVFLNGFFVIYVQEKGPNVFAFLSRREILYREHSQPLFAKKNQLNKMR